MRTFLRSLIFLHRWLGIALCAIFLLWFPSGIGMMYWGFPAVSAGDKLDHAPALDPAKIVLSPAEAAEKLDIPLNPTQLRLNSFDGRPVYRFTSGGGRGRGGGRLIYADTGEEQTAVSAAMLDRIAAAWTGKPSAEAQKISVEEVDQWTIAGQLRNLRPMYKYTWPDGQQVYLNGNTGDVVQYTTFGTRLAAHLSAIPHWLYYTPLRQNQSLWINLMIYSSLIGTIGAIIGMVVAVWMYSPKLRYRLAGQATGIPYRGQKRWHWILGMVFGVATVTWTFSGLMSLGPFPLMQRLTGQTPRPERQQTPPQQSDATQQPPAAQADAAQAGGETAAAAKSTPQPQRRQRNAGEEQAAPPAPQAQSTAQSPAAVEERRQNGGTGGGGGGGRRGSGRGGQGRAQSDAAAAPRGESGNEPRGPGRNGSGRQDIAGALRGRVRASDFASVHPRDVLAQVPELAVKEIEYTSFASTPLISANLGGGRSQLLSLDGKKIDGFDQAQVIDIVTKAAPDPKSVEIKILDEYDLYYLDRTRQRPLPVILALAHDPDNTRYYVDPKTARVVTTYSDSNWVNRWLYTGLHSLNFPFLYNHRPLWDIVVITFMVGGTALCVTSLVLGWRVLGRKLKRVVAPPSDVLTAET